MGRCGPTLAHLPPLARHLVKLAVWHPAAEQPRDTNEYQPVVFGEHSRSRTEQSIYVAGGPPNRTVTQDAVRQLFDAEHIDRGSLNEESLRFGQFPLEDIDPTWRSPASISRICSSFVYP
jgi:hypothetical protein